MSIDRTDPAGELTPPLSPALAACVRIVDDYMHATEDDRQHLDPTTADLALAAIIAELRESYRPVWRADV